MRQREWLPVALILAGTGMTLSCGYLLLNLTTLILFGIGSQNLVAVIGGGILLYLFLGLLLCGVGMGIMLVYSGFSELMD